MLNVRHTDWRVPFGAAGALALIVLIEAIIGTQPLRFATTASLSWRLSFDRAVDPGEAVEVACLGDSLVKIGVLPRVIEATTGRSAANFAMGHAPAPATYFLLRRMLAAKILPRTIVVDFKPSMLAGGPRFNLREWQEVLEPSEAAELSRQAGGVRFFTEIALGRLLPSLRYRFEIREALAATWDGRVPATYRNNRLALRNWTINRGTHLNGSSSPFDGQISTESRRKLIIPHWVCHRANQAFVEKFLALAEANRIQVIWLLAPSSPELQALRTAVGRDAAYAAFVAAQQRNHANITVVDGRFAGYPTIAFADATHLNGRGAATLSHDLAEILDQGDRSARLGWVSLPAYRDRALEVPAEDIERSTAIIDAELIRR